MLESQLDQAAKDLLRKNIKKVCLVAKNYSIDDPSRILFFEDIDYVEFSPLMDRYEFLDDWHQKMFEKRQQLFSNPSILVNNNTLHFDRFLAQFPMAILNLTTLTSLTLSSCGLKNIPLELATLSDLKSLNLSDNQLSEISFVSQLVNLISLNLSQNKLTFIPSLIKLTALSTLKISGNQLTELPLTFNSLTELDVANNLLKELPSFLYFLPLKRLSLSNNSVGTLAVDFANLKSLEQLNLDHLGLTTFPDSLLSLISLKELNLRFNNLTTLPEALNQLSSLQHLSLTNNLLATLPNSFVTMTSLQFLNLEKNRLTILPSGLDQLTNLTYLGLSIYPLATSYQDNDIMEFPYSMKRLDNKEEFERIKQKIAFEKQYSLKAIPYDQTQVCSKCHYSNEFKLYYYDSKLFHLDCLHTYIDRLNILLGK